MVVSCISAAAIVSLVSPALLAGTIGLFLLGGSLFAVFLTVIADVRHGVSAIIRFVGVGLVAVVTFALVWAPMVYVQSVLAAGQPLISIGK